MRTQVIISIIENSLSDDTPGILSLLFDRLLLFQILVVCVLVAKFSMVSYVTTFHLYPKTVSAGIYFFGYLVVTYSSLYTYFFGFNWIHTVLFIWSKKHWLITANSNGLQTFLGFHGFLQQLLPGYLKPIRPLSIFPLILLINPLSILNRPIATVLLHISPKIRVRQSHKSNNSQCRNNSNQNKYNNNRVKFISQASNFGFGEACGWDQPVS